MAKGSGFGSDRRARLLGVLPRSPRSGGGNANLLFPLFFAPSLVSLSPLFGLPGAVVVLTGFNFRQGASVTFGGVSATVVSVTPTAVSVIAPAHTNANSVVDSLAPGNAGNYTKDRFGGTGDAAWTFVGSNLTVNATSNGINAHQFEQRNTINLKNGQVKVTAKSTAVNNGADNHGIIFRFGHSQYGLYFPMAAFGSLVKIGVNEFRPSDGSSFSLGQSADIGPFVNNQEYVMKLEAIDAAVNIYTDGILRLATTTTRALAAGLGGMSFFAISAGPPTGNFTNLSIIEYDTVDVTVTNTDGQFSTLPASYTYTSP